MFQSRVTISNEHGLHLRAAARLVVVTNRFKAKVSLSANGKTVDGKSLLGITSLLAKMGTVLTIEADGKGEADVVEAVVKLVQSGFDAEG
jgi:phosphotransferase system HPr (HPr) family protein